MRIAVFLGVTALSGELFAQIEQVVRTEAEGFDGCWLTHTGGADALTVLALAGPRTRRIELGTAVVPVYPRHPTALAQQALTANAAAGGRLALGIGPSHHLAVERLGLRYAGVARYVREYVSILRPLVHEGSVDVTGQALTARAVTLRVPGARPFPILVAALAPRMLRLAGELADGTITWMVGLRTLADHLAPTIRAAAAAAGHPPPRLALGPPSPSATTNGPGGRPPRSGSRATAGSPTIGGCWTSRARPGRATWPSAGPRRRSSTSCASTPGWASTTCSPRSTRSAKTQRSWSPEPAPS